MSEYTYDIDGDEIVVDAGMYIPHEGGADQYAVFVTIEERGDGSHAGVALTVDAAKRLRKQLKRAMQGDL